MKQKIQLLLLAFMIGVSTWAQKAEIFSHEGKAIRGYDPVAFFTQQMPVKGSPAFEYKWKDAVWQFASKENKEAFEKDPTKYAPQFGGYCAYGTSQGHKAPTETDTWTIVDNKLYFNYNKKVKDSWSKNQQALIEKANLLWPEIRNKE